jgi:hypothetical protein
MATMDHKYNLDSFGACLSALDLLKDIAGDITVGDAAPSGEFNAATAASLSTMISEAEAFWLNGAQSAFQGPVIVGLSPETPKNNFSSFRSDVSTSGGWELYGGDQILSEGFAIAIRALYDLHGETTLVREAFNWLMSAASNPAFEPEPGASDKQIASGLTGTYDPTFAQCITLKVKDAAGNQTLINGADYYSFATCGYLAPLLSKYQPAGFLGFKNRMSDPVYRVAADDIDRQVPWYDPHLIGYAGLSMQALDVGGFFTYSESVAAVGDIYRYAPQAYHEPREAL